MHDSVLLSAVLGIEQKMLLQPYAEDIVPLFSLQQVVRVSVLAPSLFVVQYATFGPGVADGSAQNEEVQAVAIVYYVYDVGRSILE